MKKIENKKVLLAVAIISAFFGSIMTLIIVSAFESPAAPVVNYTSFEFEAFDEEAFMANKDVYLSQLSMNAERNCLQMMLDNELMFDEAIIAYYEDILTKIPNGENENDVMHIKNMIYSHRYSLEKNLEKQKETREAIKKMDELIEKYLK